MLKMTNDDYVIIKIIDEADTEQIFYKARMEAGGNYKIFDELLKRLKPGQSCIMNPKLNYNALYSSLLWGKKQYPRWKVLHFRVRKDKKTGERTFWCVREK